jgi:hypothetical protein
MAVFYEFFGTADPPRIRSGKPIVTEPVIFPEVA